MRSDSHEIVLEHILESKTNLALTWDIARVYQEVRKRLILAEMERLEASIYSKLGTNHVRIGHQFADDPFIAYRGFWVSWKNWQPGWGIGFEAQQSDARAICLGVRIEPPIQVPAELHKELERNIRPGKETKTWPWYYYLDTPCGDWSRKEALLAMKDHAVSEQLTGSLLKVIEIAAPILNKHAATLAET